MPHLVSFMGIPSLFARTDAPTAGNVYSLLSLAFDYARVADAIVLESDLVPSPDFYGYMKWASAHLHSDPALHRDVLTVRIGRAGGGQQIALCLCSLLMPSAPSSPPLPPCSPRG